MFYESHETLGGPKKVQKVNIALLEKVYYRSLTLPIDFIHRIQNFENMKKVYNEQDI